METIDLLVSLVLALIMLGIGLSLSIQDFTNIAKYPKAFTLALSSQMIALPLIAFGVALLFPLSHEFKVGLVILAASPGGATSGYITHLFKGNVALSLSLTSMNSLLTLFSIPFVVNSALLIFMGTQTTFTLPFWETFLHIFFIALAPAFLGVLLRQNFPTFSHAVRKPMQFIMMGLLLLVFGIKFFAGQDAGGAGLSSQDMLNILPSALILNLSCLLFGYFLLRLAHLNHSDSLTAAIESGVHNTTLAFLIAGTILGNQEMVKPALLYSMFSFWTAILFGFISSKLAKHTLKW